ncbi:hypothetical protein CYMTET_34370, partial [Cymbomonas tetramitiformis]
SSVTLLEVAISAVEMLQHLPLPNSLSLRVPSAEADKIAEWMDDVEEQLRAGMTAAGIHCGAGSISMQVLQQWGAHLVGKYALAPALGSAAMLARRGAQGHLAACAESLKAQVSAEGVLQAISKLVCMLGVEYLQQSGVELRLDILDRDNMPSSVLELNEAVELALAVRCVTRLQVLQLESFGVDVSRLGGVRSAADLREQLQQIKKTLQQGPSETPARQLQLVPLPDPPPMDLPGGFSTPTPGALPAGEVVGMKATPSQLQLELMPGEHQPHAGQDGAPSPSSPQPLALPSPGASGGGFGAGAGGVRLEALAVGGGRRDNVLSAVQAVESMPLDVCDLMRQDGGAHGEAASRAWQRLTRVHPPMRDGVATPQVGLVDLLSEVMLAAVEVNEALAGEEQRAADATWLTPALSFLSLVRRLPRALHRQLWGSLHPVEMQTILESLAGAAKRPKVELVLHTLLRQMPAPSLKTALVEAAQEMLPAQLGLLCRRAVEHVEAGTGVATTHQLIDELEPEAAITLGGFLFGDWVKEKVDKELKIIKEDPLLDIGDDGTYTKRELKKVVSGGVEAKALHTGVAQMENAAEACDLVDMLKVLIRPLEQQLLIDMFIEVGSSAGGKELVRMLAAAAQHAGTDVLPELITQLGSDLGRQDLRAWVCLALKQALELTQAKESLLDAMLEHTDVGNLQAVVEGLTRQVEQHRLEVIVGEVAYSLSRAKLLEMYCTAALEMSSKGVAQLIGLAMQHAEKKVVVDMATELARQMPPPKALSFMKAMMKEGAAVEFVEVERAVAAREMGDTRLIKEIVSLTRCIDMNKVRANVVGLGPSHATQEDLAEIARQVTGHLEEPLLQQLSGDLAAACAVKDLRVLIASMGRATTVGGLQELVRRLVDVGRLADLQKCTISVMEYKSDAKENMLLKAVPSLNPSKLQGLLEQLASHVERRVAEELMQRALRDLSEVQLFDVLMCMSFRMQPAEITELIARIVELAAGDVARLVAFRTLCLMHPSQAAQFVEAMGHSKQEAEPREPASQPGEAAHGDWSELGARLRGLTGVADVHEGPAALGEELKTRIVKQQVSISRLKTLLSALHHHPKASRTSLLQMLASAARELEAGRLRELVESSMREGDDMAMLRVVGAVGQLLHQEQLEELVRQLSSDISLFAMQEYLGSATQGLTSAKEEALMGGFWEVADEDARRALLESLALAANLQHAAAIVTAVTGNSILMDTGKVQEVLSAAVDASLEPCSATRMPRCAPTLPAVLLTQAISQVDGAAGMEMVADLVASLSFPAAIDFVQRLLLGDRPLSLEDDLGTRLTTVRSMAAGASETSDAIEGGVSASRMSMVSSEIRTSLAKLLRDHAAAVSVEANLQAALVSIDDQAGLGAAVKQIMGRLDTLDRWQGAGKLNTVVAEAVRRSSRGGVAIMVSALASCGSRKQLLDIVRKLLESLSLPTLGYCISCAQQQVADEKERAVSRVVDSADVIKIQALLESMVGLVEDQLLGGAIATRIDGLDGSTLQAALCVAGQHLEASELSTLMLNIFPLLALEDVINTLLKQLVNSMEPTKAVDFVENFMVQEESVSAVRNKLHSLRSISRGGKTSQDVKTVSNLMLSNELAQLTDHMGKEGLTSGIRQMHAHVQGKQLQDLLKQLVHMLPTDDAVLRQLLSGIAIDKGSSKRLVASLANVVQGSALQALVRDIAVGCQLKTLHTYTNRLAPPPILET